MSHTREEYDVVVLGSGAAGLSAALSAAVSGATVALVEKAPTVGGTTAVSGGIVWIPVHNRRVNGAPLDGESAMTYLRSMSIGLIDDERTAAFVDRGGAALDFIEAHAPVRFTVVDDFPDYHPELPGGRPEGGRSLNTLPVYFDALGDWADRITAYPSAKRPGFGLEVETLARLKLTLDDDTREQVAQRDGRLMGAGLVGGLLRAVLDRGITPLLETRATALLQDGDTVTGVLVEHQGGEHEIHARGGVVIATGGFEWDPDLVRAFLRAPMERPASPPLATGDGLRMAMAVGAALTNMAEAWWVPVVALPGDEFLGRPRYRSIRMERTHPRSIIVNRNGARFVNEAMNYNAMTRSFWDLDAATFDFVNQPAWLIVDHEHLRRYGFLGFREGTELPEALHASSSLDELAARISVDQAGLRATVETWNANVASLRDPEFGRGESVHDGMWGDSDQDSLAARTLGPIDTPPFYAVQMHVGVLGTKGGPRTTPDCEVEHVSGHVIPGLFAAGNAMGSVMGAAYGGAGGTLGPALTTGVTAGAAAAARARR